MSAWRNFSLSLHRSHRRRGHTRLPPIGGRASRLTRGGHLSTLHKLTGWKPPHRPKRARRAGIRPSAANEDGRKRPFLVARAELVASAVVDAGDAKCNALVDTPHNQDSRLRSWHPARSADDQMLGSARLGVPSPDWPPVSGACPHTPVRLMGDEEGPATSRLGPGCGAAMPLGWGVQEGRTGLLRQRHWAG